MACTMGDTVITVSLRGNDFIQCRGRVGGTIDFVCEVKNGIYKIFVVVL